MLIRLSNDMYINPEKITAISKRERSNTEPKHDSHGKIIMQPIVTAVDWLIVFDAENRLTLSQAHFDELLSCLPTPVEASKVQAKQEQSKREQAIAQAEWEYEKTRPV